MCERYAVHDESGREEVQMNGQVIKLIDDEFLRNWQNVPNTGDLKPDEAGVNSWKEYWIKFSCTEWPESCSKAGCVGEATDGAHVWRRDKSLFGDKRYIVPLCRECNPKTPKTDNPRFSLKKYSVVVCDSVSKTVKGAEQGIRDILRELNK